MSAERMSADEVLAVLDDNCVQHGDPDDFIAAKEAVAAAAEREADRLTELKAQAKRIVEFVDTVEREAALLAEREAMRADAETRA